MKKALILTIALVILSGCERLGLDATEGGALTGGALGAGLGAIIGNQSGNPGAGVAIGSAIGAVSGGLIGHGIDGNREALEERERQIAAQEAELAENRRLIDELRASGVDARITKRGVVVTLPDVLFRFDSAQLTDSARDTVQVIAEKILTVNPSRQISVEGHTDSVGSRAYNRQLSEARAQTVADYLTRSRVQHNQLSIRGYGEDRPVATNDTSEGRHRNRRVEVIIQSR
jgi:outer membrane protein OmpA-like peptidoglycan-associated protein